MAIIPKEAPAELLENPEINKALEEVKISAFTEAELRAYDKFWDVVSSEKTLLEGSYDDGVFFHHFYGKEANYEGYMNKFLNSKPEKIPIRRLMAYGLGWGREARCES